MLGRDDDAVAHLLAAVATDGVTGGRPLVAYAQADLAEVLSRRGETDEAMSLWSDAERTAAELGLERLAARLGPGAAAPETLPRQ
jgi:hypothetical protein